jgi:hypothetical protein
MQVDQLVREDASWDRLEWLALAIACEASTYAQMRADSAYWYPVGPDGKLTRQSDETRQKYKELATLAYKALSEYGLWRRYYGKKG